MDHINEAGSSGFARRSRKRRLASGAAGIAVAAAALVPASAHVAQAAPDSTASAVAASATSSVASCSRECMSDIVDLLLRSMVDHDYSAVPTAPLYKATENSHPASLRMMTLFRTVTKAGKPSLLAIDTTNGQAYFALAISEGNNKKQNMLWGRIKVVNHKITELELYVNRSRGDHGYSFGTDHLAENYAQWMVAPSDDEKASREDLKSLSEAAFDPSSSFHVTVASDCQFTENGTKVVDPGPDGTGNTTPLGCNFPDARPADANARDNLVIDDKLGIVVVGALIPGAVYGYGTESAFIPNDMSFAQVAEQDWINNKLASDPAATILQPTHANGETLQVLKYYGGELHGLQINLHVGGPDMGSAWTTKEIDSGTDDNPSITSVAVADTTYGEPAQAQVAVTDEEGGTVTGDVTVAVDGKEVSTAAVGSDGTAAVPLPAGLAAGKHAVTATFSGEGWYASNDSTDFTVTKPHGHGGRR